MELLNLIPLAVVAWFLWQAFVAGRTSDRTDHYFQENKRPTGQKFCNFFGIPKP
ncbi:MAG: hypothetical protein HQL82_11550 [Magnetococcales bacterium]|nr:hypothetical protein [Magnetococcales bacterium]